MKPLLPNLAIGGYRSFGKEIQYFDYFAKINIFIGQNNAGKSNILRFLTEIYPTLQDPKKIDIPRLYKHIPDFPQTIIGQADILTKASGSRPTLPKGHRLRPSDSHVHSEAITRAVTSIFAEKAKIDNTLHCWTLIRLPERVDYQESWLQAIKAIGDADLRLFWSHLTNMTGGDRLHTWEPEVAKRMPGSITPLTCKMIPAIRQIGLKGSESDGFDGNGLIERLARLQNPDFLNQKNKLRFDEITKFIQDVIDKRDAYIEIPYDRDTIMVHMDNKVLPIESLGSGIHEVILLAAAATVLENTIVCIEEPELHLNPILQKKLMRYLSNYTNNQYFITTHSAALMDTPEAEIYHIKLNNGSSKVTRVTTTRDKSHVCEDLGYHPSDLLQANCIIWVEGPSDRIYLNWWLRNFNKNLTEGIHYSIMFYGGRLLSHLTNEEDEKAASDFIALRKLNRRGVILIDSDKKSHQTSINSTKKRVRDEFNSGPGYAWITAGKEIENYIPPQQIEETINAVVKNYKIATSLGRYENTLLVKDDKNNQKQADKIRVATYITNEFAPDFSVFDLNKNIKMLNQFIIESNPGDILLTPQ